MRSRNFYLRSMKTAVNTKGNSFKKMLFAFGMLITCVSLCTNVSAQSFVYGSPQQYSICENSSNNDISSLFAVTDAPLTAIQWTVLSGPSNGTLSGFPATGATNGSGIGEPTGILYTPNIGFSNPNGTPGGTPPFEIITVQAYDGTNTYTTSLFIVVNPSPSLTFPSGNTVTVCSGTMSGSLPFSGLQNAGPVSTTFNYTGGSDVFTVPAGVTHVNFDVQGGGGGSDDHSGAANPGKGGRVQGTLNVTPGQQLNIYVGGKGANGSVSGAPAGWNGGGSASYYFYGCGGAGGDASDIRIGGTGLGNRIVVAGGGAGNGWDAVLGAVAGGDGGGLTGGSGATNNGGGHAGGGSQLAGGAGAVYAPFTNGGNGALLWGGNGSPQGISGGGGGGYYGGGGGVWGGGGGGSSYANAVYLSGSATHTQGYNSGDGVISLSYTIAATYSIVWDGASHTAGFTDVTAQPLPSGSFNIDIPAAAIPATYSGTLTVSNTVYGCSSVAYPISVTVNQVPDVSVTAPSPANQVVCNADTSKPITFGTSYPGSVTYNWVNDNSSIGLPSSGVNQIPSYVITNNTNAPTQGVFTVTPTGDDGCTGAAITFTVVANPTPTLNSTPLPPAICDGATFTYNSSSTVSGTAFTWSRAATDGISNPDASGFGNVISETLFDTTANPVIVYYIDTLTANGCVNTQTVTLTVKPTPVLSSSLTPPAICDSALFSYVPMSATSGAVFQWHRAPVAGVSNPGNIGTGNPNEYLNNTSTATVGVTYSYSITAAGCSNTQDVVDSVYPKPTLSSVLSEPAMCDSLPFSYVPMSGVPGATFTWVRDTIIGINNPSRTGTDTVSEWLYNTSAHPILVTYQYTTTANGCYNTQDVTVTVNPQPKLIGPLSQPAICDSTLFSYLPTSYTVGTTFNWERDTIVGIQNPSAVGTGNPNETLVNTITTPITVTYIYTMAAYGCAYQQDVTVNVNPKPVLTTPLNPAAICDSTVFSYAPFTATPGAAYYWSRAYVPGILETAATGTGNPNEALINTTNVPVSVVYVYTITANSCSNSQDVTVSVNPTPLLTSETTATVCSDAPFTYAPASFTPGTTYSWLRTSVSGITPATASGNGDIHDSLHNSTLSPIIVTYQYRLGINGCVNTHADLLHLTVKANPAQPIITIGPGNSLCDNTLYQNFGASTDYPVDYFWTAENATISAVGSTGQYAIVNFDQPNTTAVISVHSSLPSVGCYVDNTYSVTVGSSVSGTPEVIYYDGQFICLQTQEDSYQWGYDDASTLDSTLLSGETNQNYTNASPDWAHKYYWVMTTSGGCMQKTYYNAPTGVTNVNEVVGIKVYPNPATSVVNVDVNAKLQGNIVVNVYDMLGQKVKEVPVTDHKVSINVADLAAGAYIIGCDRDGVKIGTARFIKN